MFRKNEYAVKNTEKSIVNEHINGVIFLKTPLKVDHFMESHHAWILLKEMTVTSSRNDV